MCFFCPKWSLHQKVYLVTFKTLINLVILSFNLVSEKLKVILVIKPLNLVIFKLFGLVIFKLNLGMIKLLGCLHLLVIGHWKVVIMYLIWWLINFKPLTIYKIVNFGMTKRYPRCIKMEQDAKKLFFAIDIENDNST